MELLKWHFAHGQTVKLLEKIQPGSSFLFEQSENSERFHVNKVSARCRSILLKDSISTKCVDKFSILSN